MNSQDGGSAFPREDYQDDRRDGHAGQAGMSLRDYFAEGAMRGLVYAATSCNDPWYRRVIWWFNGGNNHRSFHAPNTASVAFYAYLQADAMLAARKQAAETKGQDASTTP